MIDFHRDPARVRSRPAEWVWRHVRADQAAFRREVLDCGFALQAEPTVDGLAENYVMVFAPAPLTTPGLGWSSRVRAARDERAPPDEPRAAAVP